MMPGIRRLLLILLLASLILILPGCNRSEYRLFTFEKGVDFSFEYPSHYKIASKEFVKDILERTTININGISGELIVYSHKVGSVERLPYESSKIIRINRTVYFDHGGLLWSIAIESDEDKAEQAKADFEHIIQTFKILD